jgi:hypothetical protein
MATFAASKFDPENDEDRPAMGMRFRYENKTVAVREVGHCLTADLLKEVTAKVFPSVIMDPKGHLDCLASLPGASRSARCRRCATSRSAGCS